MDKCIACQHYDRQNAKPGDAKGMQWGQCRRSAPRLHPINAKSHMIEGVWPHVRDDDWCGEWKAVSRRLESRLVETASGPLLPGHSAAAPMSARPSSLSGLQGGAPPFGTSASGPVIASSGRGN